MNTHKTNTLAYFDSFSGLIPCKVIDIKESPGLGNIRIKLTAGRGAYRRGEVLESTWIHVVPRSHVRMSKYGARIIGGYNWKA